MFGNNWIFLFFILILLSCSKDFSNYDKSNLEKCNDIVNEIKLDQLTSLYKSNGSIDIIAQENNYLYILDLSNDEYSIVRINLINNEIRKHYLGSFKFKYNFKVKNEIVYYEFSDNAKSRLLCYDFKTEKSKTIFEFNMVADEYDQLRDRFYLNDNLILYIENLNEQDSFNIYSYNILNELPLFLKSVSKNKIYIPGKFNFDVVGNDTLIYFFSDFSSNKFIVKHSFKNNIFEEVKVDNCLYGSFYNPLIKQDNIYFACGTKINNYSKLNNSIQVYDDERIIFTTYPHTNGKHVAAEFKSKQGLKNFGILELDNPEVVRFFSSEHISPNNGIIGYHVKNEIYNEYLIYFNQNKDQTLSKYFIINLNDNCTENIIEVNNSDVYYFDEVSKSFYIISKNRTEIRAL